MDTIDVRDLSAEQAQLVQEFVEFLRQRRSTTPSITEEEAAEQTWGAAALLSFAKDWDNPADAIYDQWKVQAHHPGISHPVAGQPCAASAWLYT